MALALSTLPPPSDKRSLANALRVYAVTDDYFFESEDWPSKLEGALQGGVTAVQLRAKHLSAGALHAIGLRMRELCLRYDAMFIVNDRLDLAFALDADGVHLGQEDLPLTAARRIVDTMGRRFIIGMSVKTAEQTRSAILQGADYLGSGAIFPSGSKPSSRVIGITGLRTVIETALETIATDCNRTSSLEQSSRIAYRHVPIVAIGGITYERMAELLPLYSAGKLAGVAVIAAILGAAKPDQAARRFRDALVATGRQCDPPVHSPSAP